ncbi:MAG TPA: WhiB family transcriptional regulator [Beutenbergiaceae bacterium]|nr:WhiB family transcriptional regulator [Beutenbergiaceae bacterium]
MGEPAMTGQLPLPAPPEREAAHAQLMGALSDLRASGRTVPCMAPSTSWAWTGEEDTDDGTQETAATLCLGCAGLRDCAAYIEAHPEPASVWAGTTPKQRRAAARRKDTA